MNNMSPVLVSALGSIIRWALGLAAGYLVKAGVWAAPDAETYVAAATLAVLALGWSLWEKSKARQKIAVALSLPAGSTPEDVKAVIANPTLSQ
jgi:hypothetical protein